MSDFEDFSRFQTQENYSNELPSFSPDYEFQTPENDFLQEDLNEVKLPEEIKVPERNVSEANFSEIKESRNIPKRNPRRKIIRGKIDDVNYSKDDPLIRHRREHVKVLLSIYGLRNDQLTEDGKEQKLDPDISLTRLNPPFLVTLSGIRRTFSTKNYLNRHIISPMEVDADNYYYRIDDSSKNEEYQGLLVEVIGAKWIASSSKITWKCRTVGSGDTFYTLYIDATSRILKNDNRVQEYLRAKKLDSKMCFSEETVAKLINTLETAANDMRNQNVE